MAIYTIRISVPDDKAQEIRDKVTTYLGFDEYVLAHPETTRTQYLNLQIRTWLRDCYRAQMAIETEHYRLEAIAAADAVPIEEG